MQDTRPSGGGEEYPLIDNAVLQDWCSDLDEADVQHILAQIPGESGRCIGEIQQAIAQENLAAARRTAHRLKGMAANLGATRLSRLARSIELESTSVADVAARLPRLHDTIAETLARLQIAS
jgi:HPt (histidine-containing phosphotransfer) domain-containing protein